MPFWQRTSEQDWKSAKQPARHSVARYQPGPYSPVREPNVQQFIDWFSARRRPGARLKTVGGKGGTA